MIILLHSSKTMRAPGKAGVRHEPQLLSRAGELAAYLKTLTPAQIAKAMHVSETLAEKTHEQLAIWSDAPDHQSPAMDSFIGDIYSGLQVGTFSAEDRDYADAHLRILSGLYGVLRPLDGICPYRLEMGYRLLDVRYKNLYDYWGDAIAQTLPADGPIMNLAAVEYSRTVTPFVDAGRVVAPRFLTVSPKTGEPEFVVVHAKIARGAFAHWMITSRAGMDDLGNFAEIGYRYRPELSSEAEPVYVCEAFGGLGLSVRLQD